MCENGANINAVTKSGRTPLHWACRYGYLHVVTYLCTQKGIEMWATDENMRTPLHWAQFKNHYPVIEYLNRYKDDTTAAAATPAETVQNKV